ncbi:polysaccharide biosynthesis/export family protein [Chitinophaga sp. Cy-1792]|uniref:polysaccharide biosynthesis/export family protein n=1 Tax=Chitinophaga sp. Cy-1792 TaxID=2608339 RepID=UPI001422B620|nr:polysaccharide biosynthesis/export family protein [Chitinophaga sp. Cy-1792]
MRYYLLTLLFVITACQSSKKITYFNDIVSTNGRDTTLHVPPLRVHPGDVLQITITTLDKDISMIFNPNPMGTNNMTNGGIDQGYLVDAAGNVNLPIVGEVNVNDKTTSEINTIVGDKLAKSLKNVYVSTRIVSFKVSVLGDVARPGSFKIGTERVSLLDALSMAGDLNVTAERDNVMVIREVDGVKQYASINLTDSKMLSSPYYYLENNDVVYVRPGSNKKFPTSKSVILLPAIIALISLGTTIVLLSK